MKRLGKMPKQPYGEAPYTTQKFKWRADRMQITTDPSRVRKYPAEAKKKRISYGTQVFTVKGVKKVSAFEYLPHVPVRRQLGHPVALGDDIIVEIHFKPSRTLIDMFEAYMKSRGKSKSGGGTWEDYLKRQLRWVTAYFFKRAIADEIKPRIHRLVPKASGRLQKGMVATVNKCVRHIAHFPHILKLNTLDNLGNPVYYANPVNNMPTEWLAHPPNEPLTRVYYHRSGPRLYHLFDPDAETDWYSKVIDFAQNWIKANVGLLYKALVGLFGINLVTMAIYKHLKENMKFK